MTIISGGQTGVDRAAHDIALKLGFKCAGFCPKGRLAEDGIIPNHYPLIETANSDYFSRTKLNVQYSDGTLILYKSDLDEGTMKTIEYCKDSIKPVKLVNLISQGDINAVLEWIETNNIKKINIAGPRESNNPGIYKLTSYFLKLFFSKIQH
jgi:hypothetical protein